MKKISVLTFLLLAMSISMALPPEPGKLSKGAFYYNANIHLGNGKVMQGAAFAFAEGKIVAMGYFKRRFQESDINLQGKHIYPGFILPNTNLGLTEVGAIKATKDDAEVGQLNPNVRSIVAYNTDSEITPTLKFNGILIAQVTPVGGLVSGLSSVVQLDAWNWQDALIKTDDGLHISWPSATQNHFDEATFKVKRQKNKQYTEQIEQIKALFIDAKNKTLTKAQSTNLKLQAVVPVLKGERKLYIHSDTPKSIIASISFFHEIGINNIVLVTSQGVEPVIDFIKQNNIPVILTGTHILPNRSDRSVDAGYKTAIKLHNAGILVALGYAGVMSSRNLAFSAGTLVSYGMDKEQALSLITANTAKILGIDDKYGTLANGKSATFFISQGDALDMKGNQLIEAYIDGRKINLAGRQQTLNQRFSKKYQLKEQE